jgi:hypothetical protein
MKKPTLQRQQKEFYKAAEQVIDEYRLNCLKARLRRTLGNGVGSTLRVFLCA